MKKAIVTGASGFIGKALVEKLLKTSNSVLAVDILPFPQNIPCDSLILDITEPKSIETLLDDETVVFHMASPADVSGSVRNPRKDFKNTLSGHFEVLEAAKKRGSKVIFPSTASVFDTTNNLPLTEKSYVKPSSPYAAAKAAGEAYCAAYHRCYDLDVRIARMFSVYGIGMTRFAIHDIICKINKMPDYISILGDGNQVRDYLYITDAVEGLLKIASKGKAGEDYNLSSGKPVKIIDLTKKIAGIMGCPDIKIVPTGKSFPGDVPKWYADITKITKIGFKQKVPFDDGLKATVEWVLNKK
jgi:UDP-glucose 4-epimerase